jgi:hypothetical protein
VHYIHLEYAICMCIQQNEKWISTSSHPRLLIFESGTCPCFTSFLSVVGQAGKLVQKNVWLILVTFEQVVKLRKEVMIGPLRLSFLLLQGSNLPLHQSFNRLRTKVCSSSPSQNQPNFISGLFQQSVITISFIFFLDVVLVG